MKQEQPSRAEMIAELQKIRGQYEKVKRDCKAIGYSTARLWHALREEPEDQSQRLRARGGQR